MRAFRNGTFMNVAAPLTANTNPPSSTSRICGVRLPAMKSKTLVYAFALLVASSIFVYLLSDQQPTLHTIVSQTHKQLNNLKNLKENLKATERKELTTDAKYLTALGFTSSPRLYPSAVWHNVTLPIVVTAITSGQGKIAIGFIAAVKHHLPDRTIVIYDLGLGEYDANMVTQECNSSVCFLKKFRFDLFPAYVGSTVIKAYRPLIIQEMLNACGAVFWLDVTYYMTSGKLEPVLLQASRVGIVTWEADQPTSALTHPRMFDYFHVQKQNFYFHHMSHADHLVAYNTHQVHQSLMLPWVQCALTFECIAPIGAQSSGCRFDKKPAYRYSGCHRYDTSAFNVALGLMFNFSDAVYTVHERIFRPVEDKDLYGEMQDGTTIDNNNTEAAAAPSHEEYTS